MLHAHALPAARGERAAAHRTHPIAQPRRTPTFPHPDGGEGPHGQRGALTPDTISLTQRPLFIDLFIHLFIYLVARCPLCWFVYLFVCLFIYQAT